MIDEKLAKSLTESGMKERDLAIAVTISKDQGVSLMYALEHMGKIAEQRLLTIMSDYYQVPKVDLRTKNLQTAVTSLIPTNLAESFRIVPVDRVGNNIIVATGNPKNLEIIEQVRFATSYFARLVLASESAISVALQKYYSAKRAAITELSQEQRSTNTTVKDRLAIRTRGVTYDNNIVELVDKVLIECFNRGASDIHVEPYVGYVRVRMRIDGILLETVRAQGEIKNAFIARFKVMCGMDLAEIRLPQDSNLAISIDGVPVDFRVSTLPTIHGEKVVLRLLDQSALKVNMTDLGFEKKELSIFRAAIKRPWGIVLVTGPTGSGKTTTLYSALAERNSIEENILTAEDPVEYNLDGVNQVETKNKIGLDFAKVLKSFLRQDPDVIMVGEIRDTETASIAVNAALTGHLVISTLHTNNSYETVTRLINMGVKPHNLVGALICVVAQRLMRVLCTECKVVDERVNAGYLIDLGIKKDFADRVKVYTGKGCKMCDGIGTKGRVAIHEVLNMTARLYDAIVKGATAAELKQVGIEKACGH